MIRLGFDVIWPKTLYQVIQGPGICDAEFGNLIEMAISGLKESTLQGVIL